MTPPKASPAPQMCWHQRRTRFTPAFPRRRFTGVTGTHHRSHPCALRAKALCPPPPSEPPDQPGSALRWEGKGSRSQQPAENPGKAPALNWANRRARPRHPVNATAQRPALHIPPRDPAACGDVGPVSSHVPWDDDVSPSCCRSPQPAGSWEPGLGRWCQRRLALTS